MGTSWISTKGGILEKGWGVDLEMGGYDPLTHYGKRIFSLKFINNSASKGNFREYKTPRNVRQACH